MKTIYATFSCCFLLLIICAVTACSKGGSSTPPPGGGDGGGGEHHEFHDTTTVVSSGMVFSLKAGEAGELQRLEFSTNDPKGVELTLFNVFFPGNTYNGIDTTVHVMSGYIVVSNKTFFQQIELNENLNFIDTIKNMSPGKYDISIFGIPSAAGGDHAISTQFGVVHKTVTLQNVIKVAQGTFNIK